MTRKGPAELVAMAEVFDVDEITLFDLVYSGCAPVGLVPLGWEPHPERASMIRSRDLECWGSIVATKDAGRVKRLGLNPSMLPIRSLSMGAVGPRWSRLNPEWLGNGYPAPGTGTVTVTGRGLEWWPPAPATGHPGDGFFVTNRSAALESGPGIAAFPARPVKATASFEGWVDDWDLLPDG